MIGLFARVETRSSPRARRSRQNCAKAGPETGELRSTVFSYLMDETEDLLARAGEGDRQALEVLFALHRERLLRMVRLRLDRRLQGRVDVGEMSLGN